MIAMAFQQRLVTADAMSGVIGRLGRTKCAAWLTIQCVADAAGGSHSLGELNLLRLLLSAGLPEPTRQKVRVDASGRRRYLDLYFDGYGLHIEIEGSHHDDPWQAWLDADRQNKLFIAGDRVLRYPAWVVRDHPELVLAEVRQALVTAGRVHRSWSAAVARGARIDQDLRRATRKTGKRDDNCKSLDTETCSSHDGNSAVQSSACVGALQSRAYTRVRRLGRMLQHPPRAGSLAQPHGDEQLYRQERL